MQIGEGSGGTGGVRQPGAIAPAVALGDCTGGAAEREVRRGLAAVAGGVEGGGDGDGGGDAVGIGRAERREGEGGPVEEVHRIELGAAVGVSRILPGAAHDTPDEVTVVDGRNPRSDQGRAREQAPVAHQLALDDARGLEEAPIEPASIGVFDGGRARRAHERGTLLLATLQLLTLQLLSLRHHCRTGRGRGFAQRRAAGASRVVAHSAALARCLTRAGRQREQEGEDARASSGHDAEPAQRRGPNQGEETAFVHKRKPTSRPRAVVSYGSRLTERAVSAPWYQLPPRSAGAPDAETVISQALPAMSKAPTGLVERAWTPTGSGPKASGWRP